MRYDVEYKEKSIHRQRGLFLLFMVILIVGFIGKRESNVKNFSQTMVSKDFDICLSQLCLNDKSNSYSRCFTIKEPNICSLIVSKNHIYGGNKVVITSLGHECE